MVGEFQIAAKFDFPAKPGKKKLNNIKDEMAEDLLKALKEMVH